MNEPRTKSIAVGNLVGTELKHGILWIEHTSGRTPACVIPPEIVAEIQAMPAADRRRLMQWLGFEAPYQPVLFSQRLDECCRPGTHAGVAARIAKELGVSQMCICHWRKARSRPTEDQARRIAELLGWDPEDALLDLRHELGVRAAVQRKRMVAAHTRFCGANAE